MASTSLSTDVKEVVEPDLIISPDGETSVDHLVDLRPCPVCNAYPEDASEGVHDVHSVKKHPGANIGDPKWNFLHCWRCGYRPGQGASAGLPVIQRAADFEQFKKEMSDLITRLVGENARGIAPPETSAEVEALKAALAASEAREADLQRIINPPKGG